jgi:hypothetical protein
VTRRFVPWSEFLRERDDRIAANQRATVAAIFAAMTCCSCGAPLLATDRYQCEVCRERGLGIAITTLERDRERRQRDGSGWRPGMRVCFGQECYGGEEEMS